MTNELYFENELEAKKYRRNKIIKNILIYTLLIFFALFTLIPFYWMINVSLWSDSALAQSRIYGAFFFPREVSFENFITIFTDESYRIIFTFMLSTVIVGVFSTFLTVTVTVMAAFAFAKLNFKGKDILFVVFLATMMIPNELLVITNFTTVANLGWLNTYTALIITGLGSVFFMFFLRQSFKQVPDELYYAAKVDGISDLNFFLKIMLPIAKPTIITVVILSLISNWNAYIWPSAAARGIPLVTQGLRDLFVTEAADMANMMMAGAFLVSVPLLIIFILFRKRIMSGVSRSGIKG